MFRPLLSHPQALLRYRSLYIYRYIKKLMKFGVFVYYITTHMCVFKHSGMANVKLRLHACIPGCAGMGLRGYGSLYLRAQNRSQLYPFKRIMFYTQERILPRFPVCKVD